MRYTLFFFAVFLSCISSTTFAVEQYMLVECSNMEVGGVYSDPVNGKSHRVKYCMEAFEAVPGDYSLISTAAPGANGNVKYLFSKNP